MAESHVVIAVQSAPTPLYPFLFANIAQGRNALKWLIAAQRPVTVVELFAVLLISESQEEPYQAARILMTKEAQRDAGDFSDQKSVAAIKAVLGANSLDFWTEPDLENRLCVKLALDPARLEVDSSGFLNGVSGMGFALAEAHEYVASVCLGICSSTTLHLATFRHRHPRLFILVTYAWTYWSAHACLSVTRESRVHNPASHNPNLDPHLRDTLRHVWRDAARFLATLADGLFYHVYSKAQHDDLERSVLLSKMAMDILHTPLAWLSDTLVPFSDKPYVDVFHILASTKDRFCAQGPVQNSDLNLSYCQAELSHLNYNMAQLWVFPDGWVPGMFPDSPMMLHGTSGLDSDTFCHVVDGMLAWAAGKGIHGPGGKILKGLSESARHLRLVCVVLVEDNLYLKLDAETTKTGFSPFDALMNIAGFLETTACYPFSNYMHTAYSEANTYLLHSYPNRAAVQDRCQVSTRTCLRLFVEHFAHPPLQRDPNVPTRAPPGFDPITLSAAQTFVMDTKNRRLCVPRQPAVIESVRRSDLWLAALLGTLHGTLPENTTLGFENVHERYLLFKARFLLDGYRSAFLKIAAAIFINHVRTIFAPSFGVDIWHNPLEQLRLSRSNPDVFLDEFHSFTWWWMIQSTLMRLALRLLAAREFNVSPTAFSPSRGAPVNKHRSDYSILYIASLLTTVEFIFSRSVHLVALVTSVWNLASGDPGSPGRRALELVVESRWKKMLAISGQFIISAYLRILPILSTSIESAANGQFTLSIFIGAVTALVAAIIAYRSFFFIALEMSGMFVAAGWLFVGCLVLCRWFWDDPTGIQLSAELSRQMRLEALGRVGFARAIWDQIERYQRWTGQHEISPDPRYDVY